MNKQPQPETVTLEDVIAKLPPGYTVLIHHTPDGLWLRAMFLPDMEFKPWEGAWARKGTNDVAEVLSAALDMEIEWLAHDERKATAHG